MQWISNRKDALQFVKCKIEWNIALHSSSSDHDSDSSLSSILSGYHDRSTDSSSASNLLDEESDSDFECDIMEIEGHPTELIEFYFVMWHTHYFVTRNVTQKSKDFYRHFFDQLPPNMFRQMVRMDKGTFFHLVSLIEHDEIFVNDSRHEQAPIEWQLAVTLDRLGHTGNGACLAQMNPTWGVSSDSIISFTSHCFLALESAMKEQVKWPDPRERHNIQLEFSKQGFPDCISLLDETLLPLAQRPTVSGECYFDRKCRYSVDAQVIYDQRRKILALYTEMPGLCSDITVLKQTKLWRRINSGKGFTDGQYLLGDSGYQNGFT